MKQHSEFDEFLRQRTDDFRPAPPPHHKERFMLAANSAAQHSKTGRRGLYLSLAALMLLLGTAALYFALQTNESSLQDEAGHGVVPQQSAKETTAINLPQHPATENNTDQTSTEKTQEASMDAGHKTTAANYPLQQARPAAQEQIDAEEQTAASPEIKEKVDEIQPKSEVTPSPRLADNLAASEAIIQKALTPEVQDIHKEPAKMGKRMPAKHHSVISVYYTPELIYNIIENEKYIHNFGLNYQAELFDGRYIIGTGIGLNISKGYYEYAMEYKEFLGTYNKLDSISFAFNPEIFEMTSTIHTSESQVFAEEISTDYKRVYRKFMYLQIPFVLGYNFTQKEKYSMGIRFSPILNILVDKTNVDPNFDPGPNQLIQINRITPERVQSNWQLAAGFNYTRSLSNHLRMEVEPGFKYYFNSVYQKSDHTEPPYGFVLRLAIGFK